MNERAKRPRLLCLLLLESKGPFGLGFSLLSGEHIRLIPVSYTHLTLPTNREV